MTRSRLLAAVVGAALAAPLSATALPATAADLTSRPVDALPYVSVTGGGPGTDAGNAAVAATCNGGAPVRQPAWFTLPAQDGEAVYARATAGQGGRGTVPTQVGLALVDAGPGAVLSCAEGLPAAQLAPATAADGRSLQVVAFLPDAYVDGTGDQVPDRLRVFVDHTSGSAPDNDRTTAARPVPGPGLHETVDTSLADDDGAGLGGCYWRPRHTAWWTYTAPAAGTLDVSVTSDLPTTVPGDVYPGASVGVVRVTGTDPVQVLPAQDPDDECPGPVTSGEVAVEAGATYLIGAFVAEYAPEPSLVVGGRITLDVAVAAATAPAAPTAVSATSARRTATLTWAPPADDGGAPVTGYLVTRDGRGPGPASVLLPADARSATFSGLRPWSTYTLSVAAVNEVGTGPAAEVTVAVRPTPPGSTRGPAHP